MIDTTAEKTTHAPEFTIERIYIKDLSFEAPQAPQIFTEDWQPEVTLELNTHSQQLHDGVFETLLNLTVTAKKGDAVGFLVEIKQAGVFMLKGFSNEQRSQMLGSFCPNILYPYAREAISNLISRGGFPPLYLAPVNFDSLYAQQLKKLKAQEETTVET